VSELEKPVLDLGLIDLETEADQPRTMELLYPRADKASGKGRADPTGITMEILGDDSPTYRRNVRQMVDEVNRNLQEQPTDPDSLEKLGRARQAACAVVSWSDNVVLNGDKLEFSRDNATRLFYERPWIARQVENFRTNPGNFAPR
jgi:hypothetical protein